MGRETVDATLYAGVRLWHGAEVWIDPEIDQGFGFANTHGVAGFPSAEAYKLGSAYPYARLQRYFLRQTIDLGGAYREGGSGHQSVRRLAAANRLVLTVGRFAIVDIFDTNKYANNPKSDFLNWSLINAGTFDYAGDGWGYTYGAAAEWYQGRWTLRGGVFDLSATPAGGHKPQPATISIRPSGSSSWSARSRSATSLWGQPGKIKLTGFLSRGAAGTFRGCRRARRADRPARRHQCGARLHQPAGREPQSGAAGHRDHGRVRPRRLGRRQCRAVGFHRHRPHRLGRASRCHGKQWGRPDDTIGIAGVINGISGVHQRSSMPEVWASSSATGSCRIPGSKRSSRPITATRSPLRRGRRSTISSSPTRPTTPTAAR